MNFKSWTISSRFKTLLLKSAVIATMTLLASVAEAAAKNVPQETKNKEDCYTPALIKAREQLIAKSLMNIPACAEARVKQFPKPEKQFEGIKSYVNNGNGDTKSCDMVAKEYLASAVVDTFMDAVVSSAQKIAKQPGNMAAVECMTEGLFRWAEGDGMTVMTGDKGKELPRVRAANAAFLNYLMHSEVRAFADSQSFAGKSKHKIILGWIDKLGRQFKNGAESMIARGELNNHIYVHGVGVLTAGLLTNDKSMIQFGDKALQVGMNQINARGFLKEELTRGSKTLVYHNVSVSHLIALYALGASSPCYVGLSSGAESKFIDLIVKVIDGQKNPEIFADAAGVKKLSNGTGTPAENYLILLAVTRPGFYESLAAKIRAKTSVNPDLFVSSPKVEKISKALLGGPLLELANGIMDFRTDFKAKICGS